MFDCVSFSTGCTGKSNIDFFFARNVSDVRLFVLLIWRRSGESHLLHVNIDLCMEAKKPRLRRFRRCSMLVRAGMGCGAKLLIELRSVGRWRVDAHAGVRGGPARARARESARTRELSKATHNFRPGCQWLRYVWQAVCKE